MENSDKALAEEAKKRQQDLLEMGRHMTDELNQVKLDAHKELVATSAHLQTLISENDKKLRSLVATTATALASQLDDVKKDVSDLQAKMDKVDNGNSALLAQARQYKDVAEEILNDTESAFRHTTPATDAALENARAALKAAEREISVADGNAMNSSMARGKAITAFESAVAYRQALIRAEMEWNAHYQAAMQALNAAQAQLEATRKLDIPQKDAKNANIKQIDVDHWTCGGLAAVEGRLNAMKESLEGAETADLAELDAFAKNALIRSREIEAAAAFAVCAAENSQARFELSAQANRVLKNKYGLEPVYDDDGRYAGYQNSDYRGAYRIHMRNPHTGFEIVIDYTPVVAEDGTISIQCDSHILHHTRDQDPHLDELHMRDILEALSPSGFKVDGDAVELDNSAGRVSTLTPGKHWTQKTETETRPESAATMPRKPGITAKR